jgi:hypothetical protein
MIAICPAGPPKLMKPSLSQKRIAPHEVGQPFAQCQPEASATVAAGGRGVYLLEWAEQPSDVLAADAGASVFYFQMQLLYMRSTTHRSAQGDAAVGSELSGVGEKMAEHLADSPGVAMQHIRQIVRVVGGQRQSFGRGCRSGFCAAVLKERFQAEIDGFQRELF